MAHMMILSLLIVVAFDVAILRNTAQENFSNPSTYLVDVNSTQKPMALLYAKDAEYIHLLKETVRYLEIISEYFEIHATVGRNADRLKFVNSSIINHGSVTSNEVQRLLSRSKLFIGVGFPYEGPGPLEAMAQGAVYIQPKFARPDSRLVTNFLRFKPTLREMTSQHPYMEDFVGAPYCYTVNMNDHATLRTTLTKIKHMQRLPGKIPKEFSARGMLERVYVTTSKMDFCDPHAERWPPVSSMRVYMGEEGKSCRDTCMSQGLMCERSFFDQINSVPLLEKHGVATSGVPGCNVVKRVVVLHAPSVDLKAGVCYVQADIRAYSCMHKPGGGGVGDAYSVRRLCPCRDYEDGQTAICRNCL